MAQPPPYTNYPRPQYTISSNYWRPPGIHFEAIGDAWNLMRADWANWALILLVSVILGWVFAIPGSIAAQLVENGSLLPQPGHQPDITRFFVGFAIQFIAGSLAAPISVGLYLTALKQIRGESIQVGDLFLGFRAFVPLVVTSLLVSLIATIGTLFCLVPGIYLWGGLMFAQILVADRGMSPIDAIQTSLKTLGSGAWMMFLFWFLSSFLFGLGVFACCVGILFTAPAIYIGIALHYHYYFDGPVAGTVPAATPDGPADWRMYQPGVAPTAPVPEAATASESAPAQETVSAVEIIEPAPGEEAPPAEETRPAEAPTEAQGPSGEPASESAPNPLSEPGPETT